MTMENKKTIKKRFWQSFVLGFFVVFLLFGLDNFIFVRTAYGLAPVETNSTAANKGIFGKWMDDVASWAKDFSLTEYYEETLKNSVSQAFWSATSKALNTIAYDTATWIGSGGKGQKPLFITEDWGTYLVNIGDNAAGFYIESLSKSWNANLCNPSLDIKIKILGGLSGPYRPRKPTCTFTDMKKNWEAELSRPDFLNRFQNMFEPHSSDLGIALSLQTNLMETTAANKELAKFRDLGIKKGWIDDKNIGGQMIGMSTQEMAVWKLDKQGKIEANLMTKTTGTFADAINIFLNQLAATLFQNMLSKLTGGPTSSSYAGDYGLINYDAGGGSGGIAAAKEQFRKIIEPNFTVRGDYDILAELTMCPDPNKAGPTNCVITDKFRQAIADRMTVGEAMAQGYLNPDATFGFTADGLEPKFNEAYPYRSMIILRKFRILPVGWEVAAQYIKDNPSVGSKTLKDMVDCYGSSVNWCKDLVDPNWVLKAPLSYCKKEGYGPEILSEDVIGEKSDSKKVISRNDNYCADEQSCIKEKADGSCDVYGYCTEEKRKWNFGSNSCEPLYNTCQTFRSREGGTVSYLQNGLDYSNCSADAVGCREYALGTSNSNGFYNVADNSIKWSLSNASSTFNRNMSDCDDKGEGCHQLIRTEMGNGANIFGGFEDLFGATVDATAAFGDKSVKLTHDIATTVPAFKIDVDLKGYYYTFSVSAKNCGTSGVIGIGDSLTSYSTSTLETTDQWQRFSVSHYYNKKNESNEGRVWIGVIGADYANCMIDGVKVEKSKNPTVFSEYAQAGVIYEKLLPNYLEYVCYDEPGSNYSLKSTAPAICNDFARKCNAEEVGCKMFTATTDKMTIPASVIPTDYCDASCNGYDEYLQSESAFDSRRSAYLIPTKAKTCGAEAVGCDGFTNLDKVGDSAQKEKINEYGAEAVEYYSELKQCVKAGDAACAEFYTWEGSSETGFQLKVYQLKSDNDADPAVTSDTLYNNKACNPDTYGNLDNPMCFEFYNKTGKVSYKFLPYTITCSDNCHPYRRTAINIDESITTQAACSSVICSDEGADKSDRCWDALLSNCNVCLNGGKWSVAGQACIYDAIPGEGKKCAATQDGCREYNGNSGANVQIVLQSDFEGSASGWQGLDGTQAILDSESLKSGENSLMVTSANGDTGISYEVSDILKQGKSYHLTFLAKGETNLVDKFTNIYFDSGMASSSLVINAVIKTDWNLYELNLTSLDHEISPDEKLIIRANGNFFIDNIILTEITDRYYLIKGSSVIPEVCNNDIFGNYQGPEYNLGCAEYSSEGDNNKHYLRQFTNLCQESAIGCEMMIDTHNSSGVVEDNIAFVVYSKDKECTSEEKGCERMGEVAKYDSGITDSVIENFYTDVYKINNPDKPQNKCSVDQVGCDEWMIDSESANGGGSAISYFKDPFDMTCEWRQKASTTDFGWYRKKISRCGGVESGHICKSDKDCGDQLTDTMKTCKLLEVDISCHVNSQKTIGYGGYGNIVYQPGNNWVGNCPTSESTCTEFIDPISSFSPSAIFNSDFSQDVDNLNGADGWSAANEQKVALEPYTLYTFLVKSGTEFTASIEASNLMSLNETNLFVAGGAISIPVNSSIASKSFYSNNSTNATIKVSSKEFGNIVSLKKSVVDYQLSKNVNRDDCNGSVNPSKGCVLFDERKKTGVAYAGLIYDADSSTTTMASVVGQNDSNVLLKVSPDRTCDKWLACKSYIKDENGRNVCYDVGLCNSFDSNDSCGNFVVEKAANQAYSQGSSNKYSNAAGYAEIGYTNFNSLNKDMYQLGAMKQVGELSVLKNGSFELFDSNGYPVGWDAPDGEIWDKNTFIVVSNPYDAKRECLNNKCSDYVPDGRSFIKLGAKHEAISEFIDVSAGTDYYLSAYVNTANLNDGKAIVFTQSYNSFGNMIGGRQLVLSQNSGISWQSQQDKFRANSGVSRVKIILASSSTNPVGNFYFDDVKVKPVLNYKSNQYLPQSCRLYPDSDSLSCSYQEDSGIQKRGWYGYCLEHDRYPGDSAACLLWYPIDIVKSDWADEAAGYSGKTPVYYCLEAQGVCRASSNGTEVPAFECIKVAQVVTGTGENKYWSGRTYEGSKYELFFARTGAGKYIDFGIHAGGVDNVVMNYQRLDSPYGSMLPPSPVLIPGEWDGDSNKIGLQPVEVYHSGLANQKVSAGTAYYGHGTACAPKTSTRTYGSCGTHFYDDWGVWDECTISSNDDCHTANFNNLTHDENYNWKSDSVDCCGDDGVLLSFVVSCRNKNVYNVASSINEAKNGAKRIFAQSYGIWTWGNNTTVEVPGQEIKLNTGLQSTSTVSTFCPSGYTKQGAIVDCGEANSTVSYATTTINGVVYDGCNAKRNTGNTTGQICCEVSCVSQSTTKSVYNGTRYSKTDGEDWSVPVLKCSNNVRPSYVSGSNADYCAVPPQVSDILANKSSELEFKKSMFVNLTFASKIDSQQLPMVMYDVNWGDGNSNVISGVNIRTKPSSDEPHSMYHLYSYWDLKSKWSINQGVGQNMVYCGVGYDKTATNFDGDTVEMTATSTVDYCAVKPKVGLKDNWGWCTEGTDNSSCSFNKKCSVSGADCTVKGNRACTGVNDYCVDGYYEYPGWIMVTER